jgi:hypothetical protein
LILRASGRFAGQPKPAGHFNHKSMQMNIRQLKDGESAKAESRPCHRHETFLAQIETKQDSAIQPGIARPRRSAFSGADKIRAGVLVCGGPPPLFPNFNLQNSFRICQPVRPE